MDLKKPFLLFSKGEKTLFAVGIWAFVIICDLIVRHPPLVGNWVQAEPIGCDTKCGVAAGESGTPGAVTCSTSSCDAGAKPAAKQCPKTVDCGAFETHMPIASPTLTLNRTSNLSLIPTLTTAPT